MEGRRAADIDAFTAAPHTVGAANTTRVVAPGTPAPDLTLEQLQHIVDRGARPVSCCRSHPNPSDEEGLGTSPRRPSEDGQPGEEHDAFRRRPRAPGLDARGETGETRLGWRTSGNRRLSANASP